MLCDRRAHNAKIDFIGKWCNFPRTRHIKRGFTRGKELITGAIIPQLTVLT
ncbi:Uncharacterised protein [Vibrio cholerae]|nr:Uncharacterised protein [Vibrio cholerae]